MEGSNLQECYLDTFSKRTPSPAFGRTIQDNRNTDRAGVEPARVLPSPTFQAGAVASYRLAYPEETLLVVRAKVNSVRVGNVMTSLTLRAANEVPKTFLPTVSGVVGDIGVAFCAHLFPLFGPRDFNNPGHFSTRTPPPRRRGIDPAGHLFDGWNGRDGYRTRRAFHDGDHTYTQRTNTNRLRRRCPIARNHGRSGCAPHTCRFRAKNPAD